MIICFVDLTKRLNYMDKSESTENKILEAARQVFVKKGLSGARMQEIANEAGINKALLHYYFRSKEKLFDRIFLEAFKTITSGLGKALSQEIPVLEKLKKFIGFYMDMLKENPHLPVFVLNELTQNPERLSQIIKDEMSPVMSNVILELFQDMNQGKIRTYHPVHLYLNLLGMLIFPIVAKPLISPLLKDLAGIDYNEVIEQRKEEVYSFVVNALELK